MIYTRRNYCSHPELVEGVLPSRAHQVAIARLQRQTVATRRRRSSKYIWFTLLGLAALPLAAKAQEKFASVVVLATSIEQGTIIGATDLRQGVKDNVVARQALPAEAIVGMEATHQLHAGDIVRSGDVAKPRHAAFVREGQPVSLVVADTKLTLAAAARAVTSGPKGATVKVQTLGSPYLLTGVVIAPGTVQIASLTPKAAPEG